MKLHAAMAPLHAPIDCVDRLQQKHPDKFKDLEIIESIEIELSQMGYSRCGWKSPENETLTATAAQMNVAYATATQLVDKQVPMAQYAPSKLHNPLICELMSKIHCTHNPDFDTISKLHTKMPMRFCDGAEVVDTVDKLRGVEPKVSNEEIVGKRRRLMEGVLDEERRVTIESTVLGIEECGDLELVNLLRGVVKSPLELEERCRC